MSAPSSRPWLGFGLGLRWPQLSELRARHARGLPAPEVLELTPSHWFGRPELLDELTPRHAILLHDVCASLATAAPLDRAHLDRVAALADRVGALAYSEHLAMTRSPGGLELGHLIPVPRTRAQLALLVDRVRATQDHLGLPVALELPTTTLELPGVDELDEGDFVHALVEAAGCGLHLDVENLRVDARNGVGAGQKADAPVTPRASALIEDLAEAGVPSPLDAVIGRRLARLPLEAVTRVHLAGGRVDAEGWSVDSHGAPVPDPSFAILGALGHRLRPRAIILERDADLPPLPTLLAELDRARAVWAP